MKRHRVAVIGCGALAQGQHLPNAQKNPRIDLVCTCDISRKTADYCRTTFGARRAETDWRKVVKADDVDVIIVATQHSLRGPIIIPALENGKPVYTEKPLAPDRAEISNIVETSRRTGVPVCVGHNRRSSPAMIEFRRLVEKAYRTKNPLPASVDRSHERKIIVEEKATQMLFRINDDIRSWKGWIFGDAEGILFAEMVHFMDLALWLNRSVPVRVFAEGSVRGNFTILLRFADGSLTTIQHSLVGNFNYPKELFEVSANNITIALDQHFEIRQMGLTDEPLLQTFPYAKESAWAKQRGMTGYFREMEQEVARAAKKKEPFRMPGVNKGHYEHFDRFLTHLEGKGENPCDVEGAAAVNFITLKLLDSVRSGMPVVIGPEDWDIPR